MSGTQYGALPISITYERRIAAGVQLDIPPPPAWMLDCVERPLTEAGVVRSGFINSWALNMYHLMPGVTNEGIGT